MKAFNDIPYSIITTNKDLVINKWNNAAENLLGWKSIEAIGKPALKMLCPLIDNNPVNTINQLFHENDFWLGELNLITKRGNLVSVLSTASYLKDIKGNTIGYLFQLKGKSITKRAKKRAPDSINALKAAVKHEGKEVLVREKYLNILFETSLNIISIHDASLNFLYLNPAWHRITGWTNDELKTQKVLTNIHPDDLEKVKNMIECTVNATDSSHSYSFRYLHRDHYYIYLKGTITKVADEGELSFVFNLSDVSKKLKLKKLIGKAYGLAQIGSWDLDLTDNSVYWSGMTKEIHETASNFIPNLEIGINFFKEGASRELIKRKISEAIEFKHSWDEELQIITANNTEKWVRSIGEPEVVNGVCSKIYGSFQDIDDRKVAIQQLEKSEIKFRNLIEQATDSVFIVDLATMKYVEINSAGCDLTGYSKEEFISLTPFDIVFKEDLKANPIGLEYWGNGKVIHYKRRLKRKDGSALVVDVSAKIVDGMVIVFSRDVSEQNKAEEALKHSEARLRRIFNSDMIGFSIYNLNGEVFECNDHFLKITGYSRQDLNNGLLNWAKNMTPSKYADLDRRAFKQLTNTGVCKSYEKEFFRKDGSRVPVLIGASSLGDDTGVCYTIEITDRKRSEKEITDYKFALDQSSIVAITDHNGIIQHANANFCAISKYSEQELIGQNHRIVSSGKHSKLFVKRLWNTIIKGNIWRGELQNKAKDGSTYWVDMTIVPFVNGKEKPYQYLSITADITERKKNEIKIVESAEKLRQLTVHLQTVIEDERKRIGREIHDELGQQLTAIKMDVVWLQKKLPNEVQVIQEKLKNINNLLDGSNKSVRKILNELRPSALDDLDLISVLDWQGQNFYESTGIRIVLKTFDKHVNITEQIATCIFRVYQESLTNIMRYAKAKHVTTSLISDNEFIIFTVEDDGIGFDTSSPENEKTFGVLGMKERVAALHGNFDLVSSPGQGTKIICKFSLKLNN